MSGKIVLRNFYVLDEKNDTIFSGKKLETYLINPINFYKNNRLHFGPTRIFNFHSKLIIYKNAKELNIDNFINKLDKSAKATSTSSSNKFELKINKIQLINASLQYIDKNLKKPEVLHFEKLNMQTNDFQLKGPQLNFYLNKTSFITPEQNLKIENLQTHFFYAPTQIRFEKLIMETDSSNVEMNLTFDAHNKSYKNFNKKVKISANIQEAFFSTNDLNKFEDIFSPDQSISVSGKAEGNLYSLFFPAFTMVTDNNIVYEGQLNIQNIINSQKMEIELDFHKFNYSLQQITSLLYPVLKNQVPKELFALKKISSTGKITYTPKTLSGSMALNTPLGFSHIDFLMNNYTNIKKADYSAHIITKKFDFSKIISTKINQVSADFKLQGKGLTLHSLDSKFTGSIDKIFYNDYTYQNLNIDGQVKNKRFKGWFDINDPNMEMDFRGLLDFSQPTKKLNFSTEICFADLYKTHWVSRDTIAKLKGLIEINAQGKDLENTTGILKLKDVEYTNPLDHYDFKNFSLQSSIKDSIKKIEFISDDIVSGNIMGKFQYKNISLLIKNALGSVFANYKITPLKQREFIDYHINIHSKIISLLKPEMFVSKNTVFKGRIDSQNNLFKLKMLSPEIKIDENKLSQIKLDINNKNPIYNLYLKIDSVNTDIYKIKDFRLLNTTIRDTLYLKSKFKGGKKYQDHYDLSFYYTLDEMQNLIFGMQKSLLNFQNIDWIIDPKVNPNKIFYSTRKDSLSVQDLSIFHQKEKIQTSGYKTPKDLDFSILLDKINLAHLTAQSSDFALEGKLDGQIQAKKYGKEILPKSEIKIKNLKLNGQKLGDAILKINTLKGNIVFIDLNIKNETQTLVRVNGFIDFSKPRPYLNTSIFLQEYPAKTLAPLFKDIFGKIRGKWTGNVQVEGPLDNLQFNGKIYLQNFGFKILALNVDYQFKNSSVVELKNQEFVIKDIEFEDTYYHTQGKMSGIIKHHNFDNWFLDLNIQTDNLLVLNTPENPLELYYGKIFVGGKAQIHGYVNHLKIDADMQTRKNTNLVLTLNDVETEGENDFIHIISQSEYKKEKKKKHTKVYEGLEMNFDLDITPDAMVKIIMDQQSGSYMEANGAGAMLLEINTNGKFNIWGDFTVLNGIYNFKYYGIIDKRFKVEPGSYISWEGDPYEANLDIKAVYETIANPYILLGTQQNGNQKNMPVEVIIYLKEKLTHPKITFDLNLPKANSILKSQIDYILSDPDRKNLQVISLLSFGNFINENDYSFNNQVAEGAVETLSERGLNLLNAMMSQDENFKVNLKYKSGSNNINTNVKNDPQVGLSLTTKINKRIYINGSVAIPVGRYTKSSIVGDMEIEVYLDKKGNVKFRIFNKQTELEYIGQPEGYTQGAGISYQVEFDTFKEMLKHFGIFISTEKESKK